MFKKYYIKRFGGMKFLDRKDFKGKENCIRKYVRKKEIYIKRF